MAQCQYCGLEMLVVDDCPENHEVTFFDGETLPTSTEHFDEENGRCHDCGIKHGNHHHPGCDVERCPRCRGQFITCDCVI